MKTAIAVLTVLVAITVGAWAHACAVDASVGNSYKDQFGVLHIVFNLKAYCGHDRGCGGELTYMVVVKRGDSTINLGTRTTSWHTSQSGSATAQGEFGLFQTDEVVDISVASVTCR